MKPYQLHHGDCLEVLATMADNSVDAVVTDPPYGLSQHKQTDIVKALTAWINGEEYTHNKKGFMGKTWDSFVPGPEMWREVYRVLKPGGHALVFAGTRTQDLMAIALRLAGFEYRDTIMWTYGCLDEQTEVATIDGVKPYHKTMVGDLVLCYDIETGGYKYQPILEIVEYDYSDTAYRLVGDFGEQVVSRNHRCIVERGGREVFQFAETLQQQACVPFLEDLSILQQAFCNEPQISEFNVVQDECGPQKVRAWQGHKTSVVRVVPFHYTGKVWCLRVPTGAFVAVRNGVAFPTGNSGFPKNLDVGKQLDRIAGAEREVITTNITKSGGMAHIMKTNVQHGYRPSDYYSEQGNVINVTAPATDAARQWQGWGTALKPAWEPVIVARKPLKGTVAANVLAHGTGAINIDGCRVEAPDGKPEFINGVERDRNRSSYDTGGSNRTGVISYEGRWPANLIHDGSEEVVGLFPVTKSGSGDKHGRKPSTFCASTDWEAFKGKSNGGDSGSAARFFYCARQDDVLPPEVCYNEVWQDQNQNQSSAPTAGQSLSLLKAVESIVQNAVATWQSLEGILSNAQSGVSTSVTPSELKTINEVVTATIANIGSGFLPAQQLEKPTQCGSRVKCAAMKEPTGITTITTSLCKSGGCVAVVTSTITQTNLERGVAASRFNYCAKASKRDRDEGLEGNRNGHPTVKPTDLMRYLCRLVTPPGGIVLDPFMGSGSTGKAAMLEDFQFIGIEREDEYVKIAQARIEYAIATKESQDTLTETTTSDPRQLFIDDI